MSGYIARQPNGLLCRFSKIVDCVTDYNMTEEDYINLCIERSKEEAIKEAEDVLKRWMHPFEDVLEDTKPYNITNDELREQFKEMSVYDQNYEICLKNMKEGEFEDED
jgi:hypothetical protein